MAIINEGRFTLVRPHNLLFLTEFTNHIVHTVTTIIRNCSYTTALFEKDPRYVVMRLCSFAILSILWSTERLLGNGGYVPFMSFLSNFVVMTVNVDRSNVLCRFDESASLNEA